MKRVKIIIFISLIFQLFNRGLCQENIQGTVKKVSLTEMIFFGLRPVQELLHSSIYENKQNCFQKYLDALDKDSNLWEFQLPAFQDKVVELRRRNLIEQIVTILGNDTRTEAELFAFALPLQLEWEGMSEGPLEEANFVDNWLAKRPETNIVSFLYLFKAHRIRAGYEAAKAGNEKGLLLILKGRYWDALKLARQSLNPLILCLADDIEEQEYIYLSGQGRP
jgi:hypothetical protein